MEMVTNIRGSSPGGRERLSSEIDRAGEDSGGVPRSVSVYVPRQGGPGARSSRTPTARSTRRPVISPRAASARGITNGAFFA